MNLELINKAYSYASKVLMIDNISFSHTVVFPDNYQIYRLEVWYLPKDGNPECFKVSVSSQDDISGLSEEKLLYELKLHLVQNFTDCTLDVIFDL